MAHAEQESLYGLSVGERLRQAREERSLTLEDVAAQTRIPIRHLRAIEESQWDELPAVTYTVGFGRSYANAVGLDGAEIGRELREMLGGGTRASQISADVYAPPDPARVPSRSLAWIAGLLLVALVAAYLIWRSQLSDPEEGNQTAPQAQAVTPQPQQPVQQQPTPQNLTGQQVTLVATGEVWFRISDGGRRVEDRTLQAQGQYQVPANLTAPTISTGRPQLLRVTVGGRDLGPILPEERTVSNVSLLANDIAGQLQGRGASPAATAPAGPPPLLP